MEAHCSAGGTTFRLAKEEDAGSNTVDGSTSGSVSACDAVFGSVPQLANNSNDYNFLSVVTFPNEF
jgi:hypothetical protein